MSITINNTINNSKKSKISFNNSEYKTNIIYISCINNKHIIIQISYKNTTTTSYLIYDFLLISLNSKIFLIQSTYIK